MQIGPRIRRLLSIPPGSGGLAPHIGDVFGARSILGAALATAAILVVSIPRATLAFIDPVAGTACTARVTVPLDDDARVLGCEHVATNAVGLARIQARRGAAAKNVQMPKDGYKVCRVEAHAIQADVIDLVIVGDRSNPRLVRSTVDQLVLPGAGLTVARAQPDADVAVLFGLPRANPASVGGNCVGLEAFKNGAWPHETNLISASEG